MPYNLVLFCSCQTYEGGIGGEPGSEAHGGYVSYSFPHTLPSYYYTSSPI